MPFLQRHHGEVGTLPHQDLDVLGDVAGSAGIQHDEAGTVRGGGDENVRGADIFVIQPTCPPVKDHLMELLIMLDAFKRSSARRVPTTRRLLRPRAA